MASGEVAEVRTYGSMMSADMAANTAHVPSARSTQVPAAASAAYGSRWAYLRAM